MNIAEFKIFTTILWPTQTINSINFVTSMSKAKSKESYSKTEDSLYFRKDKLSVFILSFNCF